MINIKAFILLAGDPRKWDREVRALPDLGISLVRLQENQHARGRRSAELSRNIYGWCVRFASGLDMFERISENFADRQDAIAAGIAWADADPLNREFYARISTLTAELDIGDTTFKTDP